MTTRTRLTLTGLTIALLAATVLPTYAHPMRRTAHWSGPMYELNTDAGFGDDLVKFVCPNESSSDEDVDCAIEGSHASYRNLSTGVEFTVRARQLEQGHAYTIWVMAFNHPEFCRGGPHRTAEGLRCSQDDHLNPATGFSIMYGAGAWAKGSALDFHEVRPANSVLDIPTDVALGPGLVNPEGAELHLRIRDHGPAQEGMEDDQINSFRGGCTEASAPPLFGPREDAAHGDYPCVDIHSTAS